MKYYTYISYKIPVRIKYEEDYFIDLVIWNWDRFGSGFGEECPKIGFIK